MNQRTNRRRFLEKTSLGATGLFVFGQSSAALGDQASEKLNIGLVGVGNQGRGFIRRIARIGQNLVAICDVDQRRIDQAPNLPSGVKSFRDFRQMLGEMGDQLDAVVIATPHHTQPAIAAAAMQRGKHVYCEKPIGHDVGEARAMRRIANETGVVTQMGNQGVATDAFRRTLEQVQDGRVGEIREAHLWFVDQTYEPREAPTDSEPVPDGFDWDLFLGPAAMRPYHSSYHQSNDHQGWSAWRDFGTGYLGMGGSHSMHMTWGALRLRELWEGNNGGSTVIRVETDSSGASPDGFPTHEVLRYHIPARGSMPPAVIQWYHSSDEKLTEMGLWNRLEGLAGRSLDWGQGWASRSGSLLVGSEGVVYTNPHNSLCALLPMENFPNQEGPPQRISRAGSHEREWVAGCLGGPKPFSNFDYAGPVIELLLLGNVCTLVGRPIEYDPVAGVIVDDDEANRALHPPRRDGWAL